MPNRKGKNSDFLKCSCPNRKNKEKAIEQQQQKSPQVKLNSPRKLFIVGSRKMSSEFSQRTSVFYASDNRESMT